MNHRLITILISLGIIVAIVGGVVSWEWKQITPRQTAITTSSPLSGTSTAPGSSTSAALAVPVPSLGPESVEAVDGTASATPTIIAVNEPTNVMVTIQITDSRLIPGSVNLQRLDAAGKIVAVLGSLNDSGTNGDAVAGDKIYSVRKSFTEAATPIRLQVSWALRGVLRRAVSNSMIVSVISLPPDPGDAGKATLGGIDSDGDGVRDDVQRYIALTYPGSAKTRSALTQYARAAQRSLLGAANPAAALQYGNEMNLAIQCMYYVRSQAAYDIVVDITAEILNTRERSQQQTVADKSISGQAFGSLRDRKAACEFDSDSLPN